MWNRSRPASWPGASPPIWRWGDRLARCRERRRSARCCHYISAADPSDYQPANITFDLLPALDEATQQKFRRDKRARHAEVCRRAIESMDRFLEAHATV